MVLDAIATVKPITNNFEVIVVDDASPDNAGKIADGLSRRFKEVKVIHHKKNRGYGGALRSGFKNASKQLVFYTDGDAQYLMKDFPRLFEHIDDFDVVNGYKLKRGDNIVRFVFGASYNWFAKIFLGLNVKDVDCDYRLIKRKVIDSIEPLEFNSGAICIELMKKIKSKGFSVKNVPVHHYPRMAGNSTFFQPKKIFATLCDMLRLWLKFTFHNRKKD